MKQELTLTKRLINIYCQEGDLTSLKLLLAKYPHLLNEPDISDNTPIATSIKNNQFETANYLILQGANINTINRLNQSILFWTAANNKLEATRFLLNLGANIDLADRVLFNNN